MSEVDLHAELRHCTCTDAGLAGLCECEFFSCRWTTERTSLGSCQRGVSSVTGVECRLMNGALLSA